MKSLIIVLSMFGSGDHNYLNKGSFGTGEIYVNSTEIVTVSEIHCIHWEGHGGLLHDDHHLVLEDCTVVSLKNGEIIHVKEKAREILKLEKVCK